MCKGLSNALNASNWIELIIALIMWHNEKPQKIAENKNNGEMKRATGIRWTWKMIIDNFRIKWVIKANRFVSDIISCNNSVVASHHEKEPHI